MDSRQGFRRKACIIAALIVGYLLSYMILRQNLTYEIQWQGKRFRYIATWKLGAFDDVAAIVFRPCVYVEGLVSSGPPILLGKQLWRRSAIDLHEYQLGKSSGAFP